MDDDDDSVWFHRIKVSTTKGLGKFMFDLFLVTSLFLYSLRLTKNLVQST